MIVVKLMGGMGNQMFQYAIGRHLAEKNKTDLKLDLSYLNNPVEGDTVRKFELNVLNIQASIASEEELKKIHLIKPIGLLKKLIFKSQKIFNSSTVIRETDNHFIPSVLNQRDLCYLEGFWQSEKYFKDIEDIIRADFQFRNPPHQDVTSMLNDILLSNSISIHIRRGDYVTNKAANEFHGLCSMNYYQEAILRMVQKVSNPRFFIFSDDINWVNENFKINYPHTFIENTTGVPNYEDLRLMSSCKHHIIANSSFSWWGAWLNGNKEKNVIAPLRWYAADKETRDLLPEGWIKVGG